MNRVIIRTPAYVHRPLNGLHAAFEGKTGTVVNTEGTRPKMYRVRLDEPVTIDGLGQVRDDLWSREWLRPTKR
jgi:hypothetical protein